MYLDHFGLNEPPFRITPHTDFFFGGANRGATLDALLYAIGHDEGIVKVTGEVGSGKTMLCRVLMERLPEYVETIYLANPSLSNDEILFAVADELKIEFANDRPSRLMRALLDHLIALYAEGRRVVVLIDEAHAMPRETLEEIRLLSNIETNRHKLLQIVLFGQPELDEHLNTAQLRQLMDRITHTFRLEPLAGNDVERYIDFRMRAAGYRGPSVFSAKAIRLIAEASGGLTRRVNILADKSLLAAFASNVHAVTVKEVRRAIRDSEFYRARKNWRPFALAAAGVAGGLLIGLNLDLLVHDRPDSVRPSESAAPAGPQPAKPMRVAPAPGNKTTSEPATSLTAPLAVPAGAPAPATREPTRNTRVAPEKAVTETPATHFAPPTERAADDFSVTGQASVLTAKRSVGSENGATETERSGEHAAKSPPPMAPQEPAQGKLVRELFAATQRWLETAPQDNYSIQLFVAKHSDVAGLENFLLSAIKKAPKERFHIYSVKSDDVQWYRLAYGSYPNIEQARAAMDKLPREFLTGKPFHLTIGRMRSQNRQ